MGNCLSWCFGAKRREYETIPEHEQIKLIDESTHSTNFSKNDKLSNSFNGKYGNSNATASNGSIQKKPSLKRESSNTTTTRPVIELPATQSNNSGSIPATTTSKTTSPYPASNNSSMASNASTSGYHNSGSSTTNHDSTPTNEMEARNIITKHSAVTTMPHYLSTTSKPAFNMNYELTDEMGVGSTSRCYRCVRKADGKEFACKVIDKRQVEMKFSGLLDQFYVEIQVLQTLNHPNIIHLEDTYESNERIYIIMELMKGGELFDYVVEKGTLSEEEGSILVRKITSAVAHMHSQGIIHRDLKPENLLLTNRGQNAEVKLIDFGLAKIMSEPVASSFLGTKGYLAPEMLQRHSYDKAIDMWALGVIVFVLLCGCLPFDDDSSRIANDAAARKKFTLRFPKWAASLSASAKDLLHNLLEINPKARYTADQALNHPWVSGKTVQLNNYLQSPCILGEKRKERRSPIAQYNLPEMYDRISGTNTRAAYPNYGPSRNYKQSYDYDNPVNRVRKNSF